MMKMKQKGKKVKRRKNEKRGIKEKKFLWG